MPQITKNHLNNYNNTAIQLTTNYSNNIKSGVKHNDRAKLKRSIDLLSGIGLIIGCVIGSGMFFNSKNVLIHTGSVGLFLIIWTISGIISIFGGLCFAELGTTIPKSGGEYSYILESFGPILAFLHVWTLIFITQPAGVTIVAIVSAIYIGEAFFPSCIVPESIIKLLSASIIISISLLNMLSIKWAIRVNNMFMWTKYIIIGIFVIIGLFNLKTQEAKNYFKNPFKNTILSTESLSNAFFSALWTYDGFNNLNYVTEEIKNPNVILPKAIVLGMTLVMLCYVMINVCYIAAMGPQGILQSYSIGLSVGCQFLGENNIILPLFISCCCLGSVTSAIFCNARVLFVAGRNQHLPSILSSIHKNRHTPIPSLVLTTVMSLVMLIPCTSQLEKIMSLFCFSIWFFFLLCFIGQIYLRFKKPQLHRPFKVWIGIPIIMSLVALFLTVIPFYNNKITFLTALAASTSGLIFYCMFVHSRIKLPKLIIVSFGNMSNYIMKLYDLEVVENKHHPI